MIEEIWKSLKLQVYERAGSPLAGAFFISWIIWNYRFVLLIFSDITIQDKFYTIDTYLYPYFWSNTLKCFIAPLITSIAFIFIYPYPAKFVFEFHKKRKKELREIEQLIEAETPLTNEESRKLKEMHLKLATDFDAIEGRLQFEIEKKNEIIKKLEDQIKSTPKQPATTLEEMVVGKINDDNNELKNLQIEIIKYMVSEDTPLSKQKVFEKFKDKPKLDLVYSFEKLIKTGSITNFIDNRGLNVGFVPEFKALELVVKSNSNQ